MCANVWRSSTDQLINFSSSALGDKISLYELNRCIAEVINTTFDDHYWVVAEISEIRTASNGHCYLELIEKSPRSNAIVARARATIWSNRWMLCRETFESVTGQRLAAGMKILVCVVVQMHEAYGFSLNIVDIDPSFTLGELALRRQEIIKRLNDEGIIDMNKEIDIPLLPQRIAIVSAQNAAGYGDFCHQLSNNDYGVCFYTHLFAAAMQGAATEKSIIAALDRIYRHQDLFDLVVIIRGGGGTADLNSFDSYDLAVNVANFPLPVIVGIGHERDNTILDMVSHTRVKTPTAAAALLIDNLNTAERRIDDARQRIANLTSRKMEVEKLRLSRLAERLPALFGSVKDKQEARLDILQERLFRLAEIRLSNCENIVGQLEKKISLTAEHLLMVEKHRLELLEGRAQNLDPQLLLRRGYSITLVGGKALRDPSQVKQGDKIETRLEKGTITSIID